jgi:hypothetical protein
MPTKGDFIIDLLKTNRLSQSERERILKLSATEFEKNDQEYQRILSEIEGLKKIYLDEQNKLTSKIELILEDIAETKASQKSNVEPIKSSLEKADKSKEIKLVHNPNEITKFLKNFEENTALKFSTHIWDKTDFLLSYSDYINKLNEEKKIYRFNELFNYNRPLYNLLNYFLFIPNTPLKQGVPKYGWNNDELKDLKIGWQFPNEVLKKWSIENFDEQTKSENKKYPMDMIVPIDLKPSIRIKNKEINSFEDVVNIFKTEIQFRNDEDNLFKEVDFLIKKHKLTNSDSSIEKLKKLHFYTYTKGVISAIDSIFRSYVKNNESFKDVSFEVKSQENCIEIQIIHLNSFPSKIIELENPNKFFSGDSNAIINHLFSLCDYSIISKFNNESNFEVAILFDDVFGTPDGNNLKKLNTQMKVNELKDLEVRGFSHKLKFYV